LGNFLNFDFKSFAEVHAKIKIILVPTKKDYDEFLENEEVQAKVKALWAD